MAKEFYHLGHYPHFIEFYLDRSSIGCKIMGTILPLFIEEIIKQGISSIGAVVNKNNIAAQKVLARANFYYQSSFDLQQDFYERKIFNC